MNELCFHTFRQVLHHIQRFPKPARNNVQFADLIKESVPVRPFRHGLQELHEAANCRHKVLMLVVKGLQAGHGAEDFLRGGHSGFSNLSVETYGQLYARL